MESDYETEGFFHSGKCKNRLVAIKLSWILKLPILTVRVVSGSELKNELKITILNTQCNLAFGLNRNMDWHVQNN